MTAPERAALWDAFTDHVCEAVDLGDRAAYAAQGRTLALWAAWANATEAAHHARLALDAYEALRADDEANDPCYCCREYGCEDGCRCSGERKDGAA